MSPDTPTPLATAEPGDASRRPKQLVWTWWGLSGLHLLISVWLGYQYVRAEAYFGSFELGARPMNGFATWATDAISMATICTFAGSAFATILAAVSSKRLQLRWFGVLLIIATIAGFLRANRPFSRVGEYLVAATEAEQAAANRWDGFALFLCAGGLCVAAACLDAFVDGRQRTAQSQANG